MRIRSLVAICLLASACCPCTTSLRPAEERAHALVAAPLCRTASLPPNPKSEFGRLLTYRARCGPLEGDPRRWAARDPADGDGWFMMSRFSACDWKVQQETGVVRAVADFPRKRSLELPVRVSTTPRWQVARCGFQKCASRTPEPPLDVADFLEVDEGLLVAYDSGEFGGGLIWFDARGRLRQTITSANTLRVVATSRGPVAFTGLSHMMTDEGHVVRLTRRGAGWRFTSRVLPGAPRVVSPQADGSFLVVTTEDLVKITEGLQVVHLHHGAWRDLYPTTLVEDADGSFFIGMRYAIAHLRPGRGGMTEEWLVPEASGARLDGAG